MRTNDLAGDRPRWWEQPPLLVLLALLTAVPLLYPEVPPLVDLPGHMGRYRVQLDLDSSAWLRSYYGFEWAPIGNLGVDLLVMPLGKLMGLEPAVKLIAAVIPPLTVAGFLWVAKEVHGRIPPTAFFALPFALGQPFLFGFVNFALSMAFAFLGLALWLRLGRLGRTGVRLAVFVPISIVVFFTHTYGWGALGLLCFSAEAVRQHDSGKRWLRAGVDAAGHAAVMSLPLVVMLAWRSETQGGMTHDWFNLEFKFRWITAALRDRWRWFDMGSVLVVAAVLVAAWPFRPVEFSRNLAFSALVLFAAYLLLPFIIFGSAFADMRLVPYAFAVALLAIRFRDVAFPPAAAAIAAAGLAFFLVRVGSTTVSLAIAAKDQRAELEALEHVPAGARVVSLVGQRCGFDWALPRNSHLPGMVIVRRHGFVNDQWVIEGANLLQVRYRQAGRFLADPSQMVVSNRCRAGFRTIDQALAQIPRGAFEYVWLIEPPAFDERLTRDMQMVWRGDGSILYRIAQ